MPDLVGAIFPSAAQLAGFDDAMAAAAAPVADLTALKALNGADLADKQNVYCEALKRIYAYDATSALDADDYMVVEPGDATGRFLLVSDGMLAGFATMRYVAAMAIPGDGVIDPAVAPATVDGHAMVAGEVFGLGPANVANQKDAGWWTWPAGGAGTPCARPSWFATDAQAGSSRPVIGVPLAGSRQFRSYTAFLMSGVLGTDPVYTFETPQRSSLSLAEGLECDSAAPIAQLRPVRFTTPVGSLMGPWKTTRVVSADADDPALCDAHGITAEALDAGLFGRVVTSGIIADVDTSAWADDDTLYLSAAGTLTATPPPLGLRKPLARVLISHASAGTLLVYAQGDALADWAGGATLAGSDVVSTTTDEVAFAEDTGDHYLAAMFPAGWWRLGSRVELDMVAIVPFAPNSGTLTPRIRVMEALATPAGAGTSDVLADGSALTVVGDYYYAHLLVQCVAIGGAGVAKLLVSGYEREVAAGGIETNTLIAPATIGTNFDEGVATYIAPTGTPSVAHANNRIQCTLWAFKARR